MLLGIASRHSPPLIRRARRSSVEHQILKDFASPIATIVAALVAVCVTGYFAYQQWRTAKEKFLLDFFDKRFGVYDELQSVVRGFPQNGIDEATYSRFSAAISRAQFLFGPEVQAFLEAIKEDLIWEMGASTIDPRERVPAEKFETVSAEWVERRRRLGAYPKEFDRMVSPYLTHHQKGTLREHI
jgi:hypothetical protein